MNTKIIQKNGFTLIELLFSIALIGFMLTIMLTTFIGVFRFYNWSKTTRNTQVAARSVMDIITKEVRAGKITATYGGGMCVNRTDGFLINDIPVKSELINTNPTNQFQIQYFSNLDCYAPGGVTPIRTDTISSSTVNIINPNFTLVNGPVSGVSNAPKSVVVSFTVVNGTPAADGKCTPSDNFCDTANFTTAVMER